MLKELIKLSNYLNNSKYHNQIQQIIKIAATFETNLSVLNDYLIELNEKPLDIMNFNSSYSDLSAFMYELHQIYHKYKSNNDVMKNLCNAVFNSIENSDYFIALNYTNRLSLNKKFAVFKDVIKEIINNFIEEDIESEIPNEDVRNQMINTFQQIFNANSIEEVYTLSDDLIAYNILRSNFSHYLTLFFLVVNTFDTEEHYSYIATSEINGGIDLLSIFKKHLNLDNLYE
jgi:RNAse (barnase) inhibitor barstar